MKTPQKVAFAILLTFFICSSFTLGLTAAPQNLDKTADFELSNVPEITTPSPEPPHKLVPISILVYTEYVDGSSGGEYQNTMTAINNTYGTDYYTTNLTDYNDLASQIGEHDIFLIPEQELVNDDATMRTVGQAWAGILPTYVNDGGIVILMSFGSFGGTGTTSYIYNETGLMEIYGFTDVSFTSINLVNTSDALARGISSSWTGPNGAVSFDSPDQTTVVDDGSDPVVIHKMMGKGHIVLLGFDLFMIEGNCSTILANAIRLHRHVIFDNSHGQYETIHGAYSSFADDLVAENFAVSSYDAFDTDFITASDVVVVPYCSVFFTAPEKAFLENYVLQGGGLFLLSDWGTFGDRVGDLANIFGYSFDNSYSIISDTDDNEPPSSDPNQPVYSGANIHNHSLSVDVSDVQMFYGTAILGTPADAYNIITTDTDGTSLWFNGTVLNGASCYAASKFGMGRVVVSSDANFIEDDSDYDMDGTFDYDEHDNDNLVVNSIRWLSAAGIVERKVLFDTSHGLWVGWASYFDFMEYLTCNGYTVHWMTIFHETMLESTHVLVLSAGGADYTPAENVTIRNFVDNGGGLLMLTDWTWFGDKLDYVAAELGMVRNSTHAYLSDSDDGMYGGNSYIFYDGANIGTHPITEGVNRILVDRGTGLINIGGGTPLVTADIDGTSDWHNDSTGYWPADGVDVFAAKDFGMGRLVYLTDVNIVVSGTFLIADNNLFLVNAFQWLSENRAPAITLTYPNGGETVNNTILITWTAVDPNKDPILGYDLLYSNDSGASWFPIVTGIMGTSHVWNTTDVADGSNYLIRVAAYDYELVDIDDSDSVFTIDNLGPPLPPPPPLPWWWWIPVLAVVIIIVVVVLLYMFLRRKGNTK